jgi:acyl phosphate:glycerol-3-phosphate acyltransferase
MSSSFVLPVAASLALAYLLGSIPFGVILTHLAGVGDLRAIGSGNIGATNVLRTGRKDLAAATLLLDALKGAAAVLIGGALAPGAAVVAAFGAFLGHIAPVWLNFRGGKGVATFLGALLALHWPSGLVFCVVWLAAAAAWRYSSLSALMASAIVPFSLAAFGRSDEALAYAVLAVLLWWKHRENIARLRAGVESRIGQKS